MKKIFWITLILCLAMPLCVYAIDGSDFDADKDGDVDGEDLAGFVEYFGKSCWYKDYDEDLYSDGTKIWAASRPDNYFYLESELTATTGDCDDEDGDVNPGMDEVCDDGADNNCDSIIDLNDPDCVVECQSNSDCFQDGVFCNGVESCINGHCESPGDPCPGGDGDEDCMESCDEGSVTCTAPDPDFTPCENGYCQYGVCLP